MTNNKAYLHFSYDDTLATVHKYYVGTFERLLEHLEELVVLDYREQHFSFSDKPFKDIESKIYVQVE